MTASNDEQIAQWGGPSGETWVRQQRLLDRQLAEVGNAVASALAPRPGESILDIGCGSGTTTRQLAALVGPAGHVTGVDISAPLLAAARRDAPPNTTFIEADAQSHALPTVDAIFSRFGVMFFADPVAAFTNLASALKPDGRLAFVCWRSVDQNPIMTAPLHAAIAAGIPAPPPPANPRAPGPFAFAEEAYVRDILTEAGFSAIQLTPIDAPMGGNSVDEAFTLALEVGPLPRLLKEHPEKRDAVIPAVRATIEKYEADGAVFMPSATWLVTARRP